MLMEIMPFLFNVAFTVNRWVHLVACTLLVGGVLFFEFVVPLASADLKPEQQLAVFGRARWVFRNVVWLSVWALILSGSISLWRRWALYAADENLVGSFLLGPRTWVLGHVALSLVGIVLLLRVTATSRLRNHPVGWLRAVLVLLLVSMFMASVVREVRLRIREFHTQDSDLPHDA